MDLFASVLLILLLQFHLTIASENATSTDKNEAAAVTYLPKYIFVRSSQTLFSSWSEISIELHVGNVKAIDQNAKHDGEYWSVSKTPTHVLSRLASMGYRMVYTGYVPAQGFGKDRTSWTMELIDRL